LGVSQNPPETPSSRRMVFHMNSARTYASRISHSTAGKHLTKAVGISLASISLALVGLGSIGVLPASATNIHGPGTGTAGGHYFGAYSVTLTSGGTALGVCITPDTASPSTSIVANDPYTVKSGAGPGGGAGGTLAYLGTEYSENPSGWTDPLTGANYSGNEVAAGIAQIEYMDAGGQTIEGGDQNSAGALQAYATTYPGPWSITVQDTSSGPYYPNTTYDGSLTVHDSHSGGGTVQAGIPVTLTGASAGSSIIMSSGTTNSNGQISFTWSTSSAESFSFTFNVGASPGGAPNKLVPSDGGSGQQSLMEFDAVPISATQNWSTSTAIPPPPISHVGSLTIVKKDSATGAGLGGAVFHVTGPTGYTRTTTPTPATGSITITRLPYGSYTITETSPPSGFNLTPTPQTVTVGSPNATTAPANPTVTFDDAPTQHPGNLTIVKKDASGGSNLAGAVFHITGPAGYTNTVTTSSSGTVTLTSLPHGSYTITETSAPPGWNLTPTPQTVTVGSTGTTTPANPTVTFNDTPPTPTITTSTSTTFAHPGAVLSDKFTVSGLPTNAALNGGAPDTGPVSWSLLGPVAKGSGNSCSTADFTSAPDFQSGTTTIAGNGTYTAGPAKAVKVAGCYGWSENLPASAYNNAASSGPNASGEQTLVTPTVTTKAAQSGPDVGATLTDTATVAGLTASYAGTLTWSLVGPVAPNAIGTCTTPSPISDATRASVNMPRGGPTWDSAAVAQSGVISGPHNGANLVTTAPVLVAGCYSFSDGLTGYGTVPPLSPTAPGIATETIYLAPTVTTKAHDSSAIVGATLTDTATVTGIGTDPSSVGYTVSGPVAPTKTGTCPTTAAAWKTAAKFSTGTLAVAKDGTYKLTASPVVTVAGCYDWTETLASTATPPAYNSVSSTAGTAAESTYSAPTITTKAAASKATIGATLTDTATVTGIGTYPSSVGYTVSGPVPPTSAGTCPTTAAAWATAAKFSTGTLVMSADGTYKLTASPVVTVAGCYDWTETLSSTATPSAYTSVSTVVGTAAESSAAAPTITTQEVKTPTVVPQGALTKTTLADTATVTGLAPGQTGVVKVTLLGPISATSACDTAAGWNGAPTLNTQTVPVTGGTGTVKVTSKPVDIISLAPTGKHCWTFTDTLTVPGFSPITVAPGTKAETVSRNTGTNGTSGGTAHKTIVSGAAGLIWHGVWGTVIGGLVISAGLVLIIVDLKRKGRGATQ